MSQKSDAKKNPARFDIGVLVEYIRLDLRLANQLVNKFASTAGDAREMHDELGKLIKTGEAQLIETGWVRSQSGQRSQSESVREEFYATEFDPPELPTSVGAIAEPALASAGSKDPAATNSAAPGIDGKDSAGVAPNVPMTSALPTAFDSRKVGFTLQVDAYVEAGDQPIDLSLSPELVVQLENRYFIREGFEETARGIDHVGFPVFYTMKTTTRISAVDGNYNFIGIHTPHDADKDNGRIIVLCRADLIPIK